MEHPLLLAIVVPLMLLVAMVGFGYRYFYKPGKFLRQLGAPVITADARQRVIDAEAEPGTSTIVTILHQIGTKVPSSDAEVASLKMDLMHAGIRAEGALPVFYGMRIVSVVIFLMISMALEPKMPPNPVLRIALMVSGCAAGWILPRFVLEKKVAKREMLLRLSLPDALDLLVVSIEAGLGLDQAIQHVARELQVSHPALSEELSLVTLEMRAGKRRADALRNLAERTGEPELGKLTAILIQNDRFGTSMGESLRTHSDFLRTRRRQEAEERAGKVGVKLVFPIFFFILPSMLIVAAGPGILQVVKNLFPLMKSVGK